MSESFEPAFGLSNEHLQTLFQSLFRKLPMVDTTVEQFELSDGDFLECNWYNKPKNGDTTPIVVLFHGLTGSLESPYIQGIMRKLDENGFSSVLMHLRGCSHNMNRLDRLYHSGDTEDARVWIEHLTEKFPYNPLFAVGYSLGGNLLLKLLGELNDYSPISAAVAVSAPMQLEISANKLNSGFSRFYQYLLMDDLKESLEQKYDLHHIQSLLGIDKEKLEDFTTFWELDDAYTAPIHGFKTAKDYYESSSSKKYLRRISTNTLVIHALDDPFMTPEILPKKGEVSSKVKLELYPHGGHVGFISGSLIKPQYWLEDRIVNYFKEFV